MPKRVLDFDALWASDKIAACEAWSQAEYAWSYGLADANGSFELTNLRVLHGRVAAIRKNLSIERYEQCIAEWQDKGLLFIWSQDGKRYGHWTGSDRPGRLPRESRRTPRYGPILAPAVPKAKLAAYVTEHVSQCDSKPVAPSNGDDSTEYRDVNCDSKPVVGLGLGLGEKKHPQPPKKQEADPRFKPIVEAYYESLKKAEIEPACDNSDFGSLKAWLKRNPTRSIESILSSLGNAIASTDPYPLRGGFRLREFLEHEGKYQCGPLLKAGPKPVQPITSKPKNEISTDGKQKLTKYGVAS